MEFHEAFSEKGEGGEEEEDREEGKFKFTDVLKSHLKK